MPPRRRASTPSSVSSGDCADCDDDLDDSSTSAESGGGGGSGASAASMTSTVADLVNSSECSGGTKADRDEPDDGSGRIVRVKMWLRSMAFSLLLSQKFDSCIRWCQYYGWIYSD